MDTATCEIRAIAAKIARYLDRHPHASDTLEGVSRWWLLQQRYEETEEKVQRALNYLAEEGRVIKRTLPGGKVVFARANREME